jgi:hypothetical protein
MKTLSSASVLVALSLVLTSCASGDVVEDQVEEVVEAVEEAIEPDVPRHPLTGVELAGATVTGPSIAIKIDNTGPGRPQVGIAAADIVFEELVEGGVTRYLAVFHTAIPEEVGPVRSGRPQDADLVASLGGVFVFSGVGNSNVREIIRASGLALVEHDTSGGTPDGKFFFRSTRKSAPLNLHIDPIGLLENYATVAPSIQQFNYRTDVAESSAVQAGVPVTSLSAVFSSGIESVWEWDEASGTYLKFLLNGSPDNDANGTQISATNVIIMSPNYIDVEGLPSAQIAGQTDRAYIATGGHIIEGRFVSSSAKQPVEFTDLDGNPIYLAPGKSFILLAPGEGSTAGGVKPGFLRFTSGGQETLVNF